MRNNYKCKNPRFYKKYKDKRLFKYIVGSLINYHGFNLCDFDLDLIFTKNIKPIKINLHVNSISNIFNELLGEEFEEPIQRILINGKPHIEWDDRTKSIVVDAVKRYNEEVNYRSYLSYYHYLDIIKEGLVK